MTDFKSYRNQKTQTAQPDFPTVTTPHPLFGGTNRMPLKAGVTYVEHAAPGDKAVLRKLGWEDGQAIPADLADKLQAAIEASKKIEPGALDQLKAIPPLVLPVEQQIENLPPERQQELRAYMQQAAEFAAEQRKAKPAPFIPGAGPGINEALAFMQSQPAATGPVAAVAPRDPAVTSADSATKPVQNGEPQPKPTPPPRDTGAAMPQKQCQHCGWHLDTPSDVEPTHEEKLMFLATVLGGGGPRFTKTYSLYGGELEITFRSLTKAEAELAEIQASLDVRAKRINSQLELHMTVQEYRFAMSIAQVRTRNGLIAGADVVIPPRTNLQVDTDLPDLREWVVSTVLPAEFTYSVAQVSFFEFQRLLVKLEANGANRDFWKGTAARS